MKSLEVLGVTQVYSTCHTRTCWHDALLTAPARPGKSLVNCIVGLASTFSLANTVLLPPLVIFFLLSWGHAVDFGPGALGRVGLGILIMITTLSFVVYGGKVIIMMMNI